jgi:hypothetical protein
MRFERCAGMGLLVMALGAFSVACGGIAQGSSHGDGGGSDASPPLDSALPDAMPTSDAGTDAPPGNDGSVGCRTGNDCPSFNYCAGPYDGPCTGLCQVYPPCKTDSQCDAGTVCRDGIGLPGCGGDPATTVCASPCTADGDCHPTETCSSDGHCNPRSCAECPSYFQCRGGACVQPACKEDSECGGSGFCVNGLCGGALGQCMGECA